MNFKDFYGVFRGIFFFFPPFPPASKACFPHIYMAEEFKNGHTLILMHGRLYFKFAH